MSTPRYRATSVGGCTAAHKALRPDGAILLTAVEQLDDYPARLTDRLEYYAELAPERTLVAKRKNGGDWERISYAQMVQRARRVAQALLNMGLSAQRPIAVLSDNDLEHLTLMLAAMYAGVPYSPISPAYSLVSSDHGRLKHIFGRLTPGLVFASHAEAYAPAIQAVCGDDVQVVVTHGAIAGRNCLSFDALLHTPQEASLDAAYAEVGPDSIAKILFTSGSTKAPKGVITTQRMLCVNQQMMRQCFAFLSEEPPVMVDWLPWNHTFGGNHNVGIIIYNGGTLYIDEGKPTSKGIAETLRNLREISPTFYLNVPKGFEEIILAMEHDAALCASFFRRVHAFLCGGAGLLQATWNRLDQLAESQLGVRIPMLAGLGMTETAPACTFAVRTDVAAGHIGLPAPGVEVKLAPVDGKLEVRFRGPNVMPGYWNDPELSAEAFDEDGFYKTGDAARFVDDNDVARGLLFDGRIAEDFKLSTGTFVSVGPLRAKAVTLGAPCVQDVVLTGINRDEIGLLVFPRLDECLKLAALSQMPPAEELLAHPAVRQFFQAWLDQLWQSGSGSASRVARILLLAEPPSIDKGEITDKGSLNQRAVLSHRAQLVEALYAAEQAASPILLPSRLNL